MIELVVKRTVSPRWKFTESGVAALYLQNGLMTLPGLFGIADIDDERIVDYIVYQLYRCRTALENGSWSYTWLFSQTALDKYRRQFLSIDGKSGMNYYIDQWLYEVELSRSKLAAILKPPKTSPLKGMVYLPSEEDIKKRFLNTKEGLLLCQQSTTGWSPLSEICGRCDDWTACKQMTAKKYPELVRYREEYGKEK